MTTPDDESTRESPGRDGVPAEADPEGTTGAEDASFAVVGLGASAGGLEALEAFVASLPADSGLAFVVVTHQHPDHTSLLPELLGRKTDVPVTQAEDGTRIEPDHVYVGPPGGHLVLRGNLLRLTSVGDGSPPLPVDTLFRSLAEERRARAIGVVLSGTGSDGTVGVKAIKAESGMAMVQEPGTARYAGMPSSAAGTGVVDYVLPVEDMPEQLVAYVQGPFFGRTDEAREAAEGQRAAEAEPLEEDVLRQILVQLRRRTGHDFFAYKENTMRRRIERRMNVHQIDDPATYLKLLRKDEHEAELLFKELLISVTRFFRDPDAWAALAEGPLRDRLNAHEESRPFRAWVAGCATGEEVYTLAIVLRECMDRLDRHFEVQIFGTDLDAGAVDIARTGRYPEGIANDVSAERLERFFVREDNRYRVRKTLRSMAIFAQQNLVEDPPFTRMDVVCCRNLLIYLNADLQQRLLPVLHYALEPGGLLFLGPSETVGTNDLFEPVDKRWKVYRSRKTPGGRQVADLPTARRMAETDDEDDDEPQQHQTAPLSRDRQTAQRIEQLLLSRFAPPSVVTTAGGNIVYVHGRTGRYLEPAEGQAGRMNLFDMAREGLRSALEAVVRRATREEQEIVRQRVRVQTDAGTETVDLVASPLEPEPLQGLLLVSFDVQAPEGEAEEEAPRTAEDGEAETIQELERELQDTRESWQATVEELEASNEELKSTNEELQSSNEELESSREELQSLNEELSTVNAELEPKVEELEQANADMENLLRNTDVATLFLDEELHITRYTDQVRDLFNLISTDVGRPLHDLSSNLRYEGIVDDCREVLETLVPHETQVRTTDGTTYTMRIRPYRTKENVIEGVVVSFSRAEEAHAYFEAIFETIRQPLLILDSDLRVRSANRAFCHTFDLQRRDIEGTLVYEVGDNAWDVPELRELLEEILPHGGSFEEFEVEHEFPGIGRRVFLLNARRLQRVATLPDMILLAFEDVTDESAEG